MTPKFPWRTVTGSDFRRSIDWARKQPTFAQLVIAAAVKDAHKRAAEIAKKK